MSLPLTDEAMSPAISFFLACAAMLGTAYGSGCANAFIGEKTNNQVTLPQAYLEIGQRSAVIDIPDNCKSDETLVGEEATICDYITAPDISLGPAFSPLSVHRTNDLNDRAYVNVVQHCK